MSGVLGRRAAAMVIGPLALTLVVGCGGGGGTSPSDLQGLLPQPSQLKLQGLRDFSWDNPTDFVVEGIFTPEITKPSAIIGSLEDNGFKAASGHIAIPQGGGPDVHFDVARFDSADGAEKARDYLHGQDLMQPCYSACTVNPQNYTVPGIPNAKGVHQVPNGQKPPPGAGPFERYAVEFTIGQDLYIVDVGGDPGSIPESRFDQGAKQIYDFAKQHSG